jgi:hypothetical protein
LIGRRLFEFLNQPEPELLNQLWEQMKIDGVVIGQLPAMMPGGLLLNLEIKAFANVAPDRNLVIFRDISGQDRFETQTRAFLKLGRQLTKAPTAVLAARIITRVADELVGWDGCFLERYSAETDRIEPLVTIDTIDAKTASSTNIRVKSGSFENCGRMRLSTKVFSKPWSPTSRARKISAIPPNARRRTNRYFPKTCASDINQGRLF